MKIAAISIADYSECTEGMPHDVERLFFRMLLKMLSREGGLPDDDSDNARIFGYKDVRTYRVLKSKLAAWPNAIVICDGMITNERVESDLQTYRDRKAAAVENGRIGGRSNRDRKRIDARSDGDQREIDPRCQSEVETISHATTQENNDLTEPSPTPSPTPKEERENIIPFSFSETARSKPVSGREFWANAINPVNPDIDFHIGVTMRDGVIKLHNEFKNFWLNRFDGNAERLEMALVQAAGYVQPNSSRPLEAQVGSQLARLVGNRMDREQRSAAKAPIVSAARQILNRKMAEARQ
jgi:uncharacterized protein YdaU (DUF1376 family)